MSLEQDIRAEIENIKKLKMEVGNINNHLSILEGLCRGDMQKQVEEAHQKGINGGSLDVKQRVEGAYQSGLEDAWEAARKIVCTPHEKGLGREVLDTVFGNALDRSEIMFTYSAQEAIAKLKDYEEKQETADEIKVGDVVRLCRHTVPYIVTSCDGDDDTYILMTVNGGFIKVGKYNVRKTGRHFDISSILEAMHNVLE